MAVINRFFQAFPQARTAWSRVGIRPFRFLLVGISGVFVSTTVLWLVTRGAGLSPFWGGLAASITSTGTNFLLNDIFTWRDRWQAGLAQKLRRMLRYYSTTAAGNLIYLGVFTALVHVVGAFDLFANLVAIGVGGAFNYLVHNVWTWQTERR